ncbi:MAG: hypothetical protein KGL39_21770 [Patescibacteria group bacterium]|nr:hypothetical protein [Patescibacteria group bacterium]
MALPYVFANLGGNQQSSTLDANFNAVAQMGSIFCSAAGTNAITLAPNASQPNVTAYTNNTLFAFNASATPTSAVTIQVGSLGALNVYYSDGATQINSGAFISGQFVIVVYLASLNGGAGGFSFVNGALLSALIDLQLGNTQGSILYRDASTWKALGPGASGEVLSTRGAGADPIWSSALAPFYIWVQNQQPSGTSGETINSGTWTRRVLNTVNVNTIVGASLASNQITLPAGTYNISCVTSAESGTLQKLRLWNATTSSLLIVGVSGNFPTGQGFTLAVQGQFVLAGITAVEIDQYSVGGGSGGQATGAPSTIEVFADVFITKIA